MAYPVCPKCSKDVGALAFMLAPHASYIKCPHCKTILKHENFPKKRTAFLAVLLAILIATLLIWLEKAYSRFAAYVCIVLLVSSIPLLQYFWVVKIRKTALLNISDDPKFISKRTKYFIVGYVVFIGGVFLLWPNLKVASVYMGCRYSDSSKDFSDSDKLHSFCSCKAQAYVAAGLNPNASDTEAGRAKLVHAEKSCMDKFYQPVFIDICLKRIQGENSFFKAESVSGCRCLYRKSSEIYIQTGDMKDKDQKAFWECLGSINVKNSYYAVCMERVSVTFPDFHGPQSSLNSFCGCFAKEARQMFHDSYDSNNPEDQQKIWAINYQCWQSHIAPYQTTP